MSASPVLRIISVAYGKAIEGGKEIRYVLNGTEGIIQGNPAKDIELRAIGGEGLINDLPYLEAGFLGLIIDIGQNVDAMWMTKEELAIHQKNQRQAQGKGQGIGEG